MQPQRQLGELSVAEVESVAPTAESVLDGRSQSVTVQPEAVKVGLYYGQLSGQDLSGTRVLIKVYSSTVNNAVAAARARAQAASGGAEEARMRERLMVTLGGGDAGAGGGGGGDDDGDRRALEALLSSDGMSLAEALAENEFAAHCRVQAAIGPASSTEKELGIAGMIGRLRPEYVPGEDAVIMHAFPWKGEGVRMALPTSLPPTLAGWVAERAAGETAGSLLDKSSPLQAAQQRARFVRSALRDALRGLASLHAAGLLHQSLSAQAVLLSSGDDKVGEKVKGALLELGFCRDARSMALAYRAGPDGAELPRYEGVADPLDAGLLERAVLNTRRPGDAEERAAFGRADDLREFGMLVLTCFVLGNAPAGGGGGRALGELELRQLCDGAFAARADGMPTDGVDTDGLRGYLDAEDGLRVGGVGGLEMLGKGGGWELLTSLMHAEWDERPTAEEALAHPFWSAPLFF